MKKIFSKFVSFVLVFSFFAPAMTFAAGDGLVVIDTINGFPPASVCIAGAITIAGHGTTGSQGGPYSVDIEWGDGSITTQNIGNGGGNPFTFTATHTPTQVTTTFGVYLYHGSRSGNDSHANITTFCAAPPTTAVLTVIKHVVNDNLIPGTATASDFNLHVKNSSSVDVPNGGNGVSSPALGSETGKSFIITPSGGAYTVSEDAFAGYTQTGITGSCATNGSITLVAGNNYTCTITNNDTTNNPPTFSNGPITASIPELAPFTFTAIATDTDVPAQTLTFSLTGTVPAGASITSDGLFTWTPTEAQGPGSYAFTVRVSDGTNNTDAPIALNVTEVNQLPVADDKSTATNEDTSVNTTLSATDTDIPSQTLSYSILSNAL